MLSLMLLPLLAVSVYLNVKQYQERKGIETITTSVVATEAKAQTFVAPEPDKEDKVVGDIVVPLPRPAVNKPTNPQPTTAPDSAEVFVPPDTLHLQRVQREFSDSSFTAWVSGYDPKIDSIKVRERIITTTNTITQTKKEYRRWNVGITAGYGYGLTNRQFEPFVGVGITYNIFK